jgi:hypothetical protein
MVSTFSLENKTLVKIELEQARTYIHAEDFPSCEKFSASYLCNSS